MHLQHRTYLEEVTVRTMQAGGTASKPDTGEFLPARDVWCFPKYPSKTVILPSTADLLNALQQFVEENETLLSEPDCWLGTWVNPKTGDYYLDIATGIQDLEEATRAAIQAGIVEGRRIAAIFNPVKNQTIFL